MRWAPVAPALACLILSLPLKLFIGAGGPLWLDEGWTLGIVEQHGAAFGRQLLWDPNPPFYFVTLKLWTLLAGLSDGALRTPSVLAALIGPLFALTPGTGLGRRERWAWAALLCLWAPGTFFAQEARGYALLFGLECAVAAAFLRLLHRPSLGAATVWSGLSALALLTHHHALPLAALQGLALLWLKRKEGVGRLWPAALLFLPPFAWLAVHAPRVAAFSRPDVAWYPLLRIADLEPVFDFLFSGPELWAALLGLLAVGFTWRRLQPEAANEPAPPLAHWAPVACSVLACALVVAAGFLRASFTFRYLTAYAPGLLLGAVLALQAVAGRRAGVLGLVALSFALVAAVLGARGAAGEERRALQFETASEDLARGGVRHVAFLWDNPTNRVLAPDERSALARAFFERLRTTAAVTPLVIDQKVDPAPALYAAAPNTGDAYLWVYDLRVPGTAAQDHPPRPSPLRPGLSCRRYTPDADPRGVLACIRRPAPASPGAAPAPK